MSTEKEIKNEAAVAASAEQTANAEVQTPKKRRGRGINNDLRDVTRKKFDERTDCNKANGLFIGHLEDVKVDWATLKDDVQGMPSFAGMSIPYRDWETDRKSTRLNSSHRSLSRMPSSA